jgi:hypothetical protein
MKRKRKGNDMNSANSELLGRIEEARQWDKEDFPGNIEEIKSNSYKFEVSPLKFFDVPTRKARYGVQFRLIWQDDNEQKYFVDVEIRLSPHREGGPRISIFAVSEDESEKTNLITHANATNELFTKHRVDSSAADVRNFFRSWLLVAVLADKFNQVFQRRKPLERLKNGMSEVGLAEQ